MAARHKIKRLSDEKIFEQMVGIYQIDKKLIGGILKYLALRDELVRRHGTWLKAKAHLNRYLHERNLAGMR